MSKVKGIRRPKGLGMVELLISLTIMALLLTSVAGAFHASSKTIDENHKVSTVAHNARIVLNRMVTQARRADWIPVRTNGEQHDWLPEIEIEPPEFSGPTLIRYDLQDGVLWYRETVAGEVKSYAILGVEDGVTVNEFLVWYEQVDEDGDGTDDYVSHITADLDLQVGGNRLSVASSSHLRRNMDW